MMIEQTKQHVEQQYTIANGYEHDAKVGSALILSFKQIKNLHINFNSICFYF